MPESNLPHQLLVAIFRQPLTVGNISLNMLMFCYHFNAKHGKNSNGTVFVMTPDIL
jgi:hypothetical protein